MERLPGLGDVPPAPRTPSRQARYLVFGYRGSQGVMLIIGVAFLVIGLVVTTALCWGLPVDAAIAFSRQQTVGTILEAELNPHLRINKRRPTLVRFRYEADGTPWEGETNTFKVRPGQTGTVVIEYSGFNPAWGRLEGDTYSSFGLMGLVALLFPVLGAVIASAAVRSNRREIRAFTHGRPALARVTYRGQDHSTSVNGRHPFLMRWEFHTERGNFQGSITSMKLLDIKAFGDAGEVVVLYDEADPRINTLFVP